jgi:myo-inositol-1-phosphate synthase
MSKKVRVAIIGVGNCASSLVQGVEYYKHADPGDFVPGLMHVTLGGYHISDIEFSAAFDIDREKVGYVEHILASGCGMVNCMPVFIARERYWQQRFEQHGLPVIGDDIKSQVGATVRRDLQ